MTLEELEQELLRVLTLLDDYGHRMNKHLATAYEIWEMLPDATKDWYKLNKEGVS
jgi:hypothetical protein